MCPSEAQTCCGMTALTALEMQSRACCHELSPFAFKE